MLQSSLLRRLVRFHNDHSHEHFPSLPMRPKSGLQRDVLSLYRSFWRVTRLKAEEERESLRNAIRQEFRLRANTLLRTDVTAIEFLIRRGKKQLELLSMKSVTGIRMQEKR